MCVTMFLDVATVDIPISTDLPLSTNIPMFNSSANGSDIVIIVGGFIILLIIIIIALLYFGMLWRPQRKILSMDGKPSCASNELNTNDCDYPNYDVIGHPLYDVADHPLYDVNEPNAADDGTTAKATLSYPSYNALTKPYSKEECSYEQPYGGLDEAKMNTDPAYAVTARRDWSKTNKEGCDHVQLNKSMLCDVIEPNAVDIQPKEFTQQQDLNESTKMNTDPAYAGLSTREDRALIFSATVMHSNTKPHQPSHDATITVEQHDSVHMVSQHKVTHKTEGTIV